MIASARTWAVHEGAVLLRAGLALCLSLGIASATHAETKESAAAGAPSTDSAIGLDTKFFKSDEPIEITADRLDVDQINRRAVFGGNVNAVQGDVHLAGEILTVFYDQDSAEAAQAPPASDVAATGGRIKRMEVKGGVHVSSPTEIATGDDGVYDLEAGTIILLGNVVITRGGNILRGSRLNIDVESGRSVIVGSAESGRVKGLFVPKSQTADKADATQPGNDAP